MPFVFTADLLIPVSSKPIRSGWLEVEEDGTIRSIHDGEAPADATKIEGVLIPGFVNAHCHLELSHLRGRLSENRGMTNFIRELISKRFSIPVDQQIEAMKMAEEEMVKNGIVAVGDISNFEHSVSVKEKNKIYYHTFVEILGLNPKQAEEIIEKGKQLLKIFSVLPKNAASIVPHAPYSVSDNLFDKIKLLNSEIVSPSSIHMEESEDENNFCRNKNGNLAEFYMEAGIDFSAFISSPDLSPIKRVLPKLKQENKILFVHNTYLTLEEAELAEQLLQEVYWCLCPNANLFITGQLPDFTIFNRDERNVCIGTDSLASNHQLSIFEELKTIHNAAPEISFEKLIKWSTWNGAKYLGVETQFGQFKKGTKPGLIAVNNINSENLFLDSRTNCTRIL